MKWAATEFPFLSLKHSGRMKDKEKAHSSKD